MLLLRMRRKTRRNFKKNITHIPISFVSPSFQILCSYIQFKQHRQILYQASSGLEGERGIHLGKS
ncbi:hypothetical protein H5410_036784 [Solanum commersonii]|uniref:Uncharacterized protein n=1 Tax=Solanum commersonii TaxID=4109 RepID=A0A9J5Y7K2_SOLCO|nr:hypothetical protein H5410_036784 [Solanum commersonii]